MSRSRPTKEFVQHSIAYFAWLCLLVSTSLPAPVQSDFIMAEDCDCERERRERAAYVIAGLTVVGIVTGIVVLLGTSSSCHRRHHRRYSDYYSYYSYSYESRNHHRRRHNDRNRQNGRQRHLDDYSEIMSDFNRNDVSSWSGGSEDTFNNIAARCKVPYSAVSDKKEKVLTGHIITHPSAGQEGSATVFVQMPDGTSRSLGNVSLSTSNSLSYGPFDQTGTYTFGMSLDQENAASSPLKIGTIQAEINGATVQQHDFTVPAHAPRNYEPSPCTFCLN